jgi:mannose-6-phosphate isomerase-like protein (cupin superfamily)
VWIANNPLYCGEILEITKGERCFFHFHNPKSESFYLRSGRLRIRLMASARAESVHEFELYEGECMDICPGLVHQMEALDDSELYEFSTQHYESDSYRLIIGD